jgi:hypothetical protein
VQYDEEDTVFKASIRLEGVIKTIVAASSDRNKINGFVNFIHFIAILGGLWIAIKLTFSSCGRYVSKKALEVKLIS